MDKKRRIVKISVIIILLLVLVWALPPIMIAQGVPRLGKVSEDVKTHLQREEQNFANRQVIGEINPTRIYFFNIRFWEQLEIKEVEFAPTFSKAGVKDADQKKILPFLYSVQYENPSSYQHCYEVRNGSKTRYYDLYTSDI
ncbi:MAG: hypothetical protein PHQ72_00685 [Hespellia sp.]|nr:hypothetical protein [Hespellia sp.]